MSEIIELEQIQEDRNKILPARPVHGASHGCARTGCLQGLFCASTAYTSRLHPRLFHEIYDDKGESKDMFATTVISVKDM